MRDNKTEKNILEAAEEEFLLKGFAGARTTEIARRAGVTHAMLHYYFHTKEQLYEQVLMDKIDLFRASVVSVFEVSDMPVTELVIEAMSRHFDFVRRNPMLPRFIINEMSVRPDYIENIKPIVAPITSQVVARLQRSLDEAADRGEVRRMDAFTLMMDVVSLNLFVFVAHPIVQHIVPFDQLEAFYEARKQENIAVITHRLIPSTPCDE